MDRDGHNYNNLFVCAAVRKVVWFGSHRRVGPEVRLGHVEHQGGSRLDVELYVGESVQHAGGNTNGAVPFEYEWNLSQTEARVTISHRKSDHVASACDSE